MNKKLYRSASDKKIAGVCGGIAQYFGLDSTLIRLAFALFVVLAGTGLWAYIICAIVIPEEPADSAPQYTNYTDYTSPENK